MKHVILSTLIALLVLTPALADDVVRQDGKKLKDTILTIREGNVELKESGGVQLGLLRDLILGKLGKPEGKLKLRLTTGDLLHCDLASEQGGSGVTIQSKTLGGMTFKTNLIRLLDFGGKLPIPAGEKDEDEDVLYIEKGDKVHQLKGSMDSINNKELKFFWSVGGGMRTVPLAKVRGLRIGRVDKADLADFRIKLTLVDGSTLTGDADSFTLTRDEAILSHGSGKMMTIARKQIARIGVTSDWVLYLSGLKPTSADKDRLYDIDLPTHRNNTDIWGGSLAPYTNGVGTYATTKLAYDIKGRYKTFHANVWVAKLAKTAGTTALKPQGAVVFRVYADGKKVFDSGLVKIGQKAKPISVDVTDVKELIIETDRGPGWGIGDAGNWGDAKVTKGK